MALSFKHLLPVLGIGIMISCEPEDLREVYEAGNLSTSYFTSGKKSKNIPGKKETKTENLREVILEDVTL